MPPSYPPHPYPLLLFEHDLDAAALQEVREGHLLDAGAPLVKDAAAELHHPIVAHVGTVVPEVTPPDRR